jgi:hypothetical protein
MGEKGVEEKVFMVFCESFAIHNSMTFFNVNYVGGVSTKIGAKNCVK